MKWLTLLLTFSLVSCAHQETTYVYSAPTTPADPVYRGVAQVYLEHEEGVATGAGFVIGSAGDDVFVMTADHICLKVGRPAKVATIPPHEGVREEFGGRVVYTAEDGDACIVRVFMAIDAFSVLTLAPNAPRTGDRVHTIGAPSGTFPTKTSGWVVGHDFLGTELDLSGDPKMVLVTSIPAYAGNSGGPVYNERHEIVGMISAVHSRYPHSSISVHIEFLREHINTYFESIK